MLPAIAPAATPDSLPPVVAITPASQVEPSPTASPRPVETATPLPLRQGPTIRVARHDSPTPTPVQPVKVRPAAVARLELPGGAIVPVGRSRAEPVGDGVIQWAVPRSEAGQHDGTPGCGQPGNTIIVGHSVWYGEQGVFARLNAAEPGQLIRCVNDDGQLYTYQINRKWESAYEDGSWLTQPETGELLTLYTCRTDLTALVVVQAKRVDDELE